MFSGVYKFQACSAFYRLGELDTVETPDQFGNIFIETVSTVYFSTAYILLSLLLSIPFSNFIYKHMSTLSGVQWNGFGLFTNRIILEETVKRNPSFHQLHRFFANSQKTVISYEIFFEGINLKPDFIFFHYELFN